MVSQFKLLSRFLTVAAFATLAGCGGGGTNNDQGVSFTLLGFAEECQGATTEPNLSGLTVPFSVLGPDEAGTTSGAVIAGLVMQNRLSAQFIRTQQVFLTFNIPGATIQPPSTSVPFGTFIDHGVVTVAGTSGGGGVAGGGTATGGSTTGAGTGTGTNVIEVTPTTGCGESFIVPAEIRQWLVLNRNYLPELPFTMELKAVVTGLTSAGDRLDSNEANLAIQFTPDIVIETDGDSDTDGGSTVDGGTDTGGTDTDTSGTDGDTSTGDTPDTGTDTDTGAGL